MNKKKISNIFIYLLFFVFLGIFLFSGYKLFIWKKDNDKGNDLLEEINKDIRVIVKDKEEKYDINFDNLRNKNSDTVAFIKVNGTNIMYPIVKSSDNSYYLNHSFDKSVNGAGWVFANYLNKFDGTDKNISIFGHARFDGSMFGTLYKTLSSEWQDNKNNLFITFITSNGDDKYRVFSTYKILSEDYYINNSFSSNDEYKSFLDTIKSRSNYDYGVNLNTSDKIITLSSCASDDRYRIVLHAKKIVNDEEFDIYE